MKTLDHRLEASNNLLARYIPEIVARLQQISPTKLILFGSQARGDASETSDLDLIVVTSSDRLPASHREKEDAYLEVARLLRDIRREVSIDLIVHTQPMHARFMALDSLFAREVQQKGVVLYELVSCTSCASRSSNRPEGATVMSAPVSTIAPINICCIGFGQSLEANPQHRDRKDLTAGQIGYAHTVLH